MSDHTNADSGDRRTVRLVYIHGFRGDHTSFQSFPTDLHERLEPRLSKNIFLLSIIYPTYKSVRPISEATSHFLDWLSVQIDPDGPVILLAHSMGGLLAADAALSRRPEAARIIGIISFDVPFLGMHPHVIISGIASLFQDDQLKSEGEVNDPNSIKMPATVGPNFDLLSDDVQSTSPSASIRSTEPGMADGVLHSMTKHHHRYGFSLSAKIDGLATRHATNSFVIWLKRHKDDPFTSMYRWIVKNLEFGICMFDPPGLLERFSGLRKWEGKWINYWTETVGDEESENVQRSESKGNRPNGLPNNTAELQLIHRTTSNASSISSDSEDVEEGNQRNMWKKEILEQRTYENAHRKRPPRHFIVLPGQDSEARDSWERIKIRHAKDEVQAHCGLFVRTLNDEYDFLVSRVVGLLDFWCKDIQVNVDSRVSSATRETPD